MGSIGDRVLDNGLDVLNSEGNRLDICSQEPTTFAEATSTHTLANKTSYSAATPSAKGGGGREAIYPEITDGTVTGTGTGTHFATVDTVNSRLLGVQQLADPQGLTSGNEFTLTSFTIGNPGV